MGNCEIIDKLERAHRLVHHLGDYMSDEEAAQVDELAQYILSVMNEDDGVQQYTNGVKMLAIFQVLTVGVDIFGELLHELRREDNSTVTIH